MLRTEIAVFWDFPYNGILPTLLTRQNKFQFPDLSQKRPVQTHLKFQFRDCALYAENHSVIGNIKVVNLYRICNKSVKEAAQFKNVRPVLTVWIG